MSGCAVSRPVEVDASVSDIADLARRMDRDYNAGVGKLVKLVLRPEISELDGFRQAVFSVHLEPETLGLSLDSFENYCGSRGGVTQGLSMRERTLYAVNTLGATCQRSETMRDDEPERDTVFSYVIDIVPNPSASRVVCHAVFAVEAERPVPSERFASFVSARKRAPNTPSRGERPRGQS